MMYGNWNGWGWMMLMPLLWIAVLAVAVWAVVRLTRNTGDYPRRPSDDGSPRRETPQEILDRRYASGEINADAYREARALLAGHGSGSP